MREEIGRKNEAMIYNTLFYKRRSEFERKKKTKDNEMKLKSVRTSAVMKEKYKIRKNKSWLPYGASALLKKEVEQEKSFESSDLSSTNEEKVKKYLPD